MKLIENITEEGKAMEAVADSITIKNKTDDVLLNGDADDMMGLHQAIEAHLEEVESNLKASKEPSEHSDSGKDKPENEFSEAEINQLLAEDENGHEMTEKDNIKKVPANKNVSSDTEVDDKAIGSSAITAGHLEEGEKGQPLSDETVDNTVESNIEANGLANGKENLASETKEVATATPVVSSEKIESDKPQVLESDSEQKPSDEQPKLSSNEEVQETQTEMDHDQVDESPESPKKSKSDEAAIEPSKSEEKSADTLQEAKEDVKLEPTRKEEPDDALKEEKEGVKLEPAKKEELKEGSKEEPEEKELKQDTSKEPDQKESTEVPIEKDKAQPVQGEKPDDKKESTEVQEVKEKNEEEPMDTSAEKPTISLVPVSADDTESDDDEEEQKSDTDKDKKQDEVSSKAEEKPAEEPIKYGEALEELTTISQKANALDEESENKLEAGKKRTCTDEEDTEAKRAKTDDEPNDGIKQTVKKQLKRFSRNDLEDVVANKMVEVISNRSEIGDLRKRCQELEDMNIKWKRKSTASRKMLQDLVKVVKKYIIDVQCNKKDAKPIKITRSVGLQLLDNTRRVQPKPKISQPDSKPKAQVTLQPKKTSTLLAPKAAQPRPQPQPHAPGAATAAVSKTPPATTAVPKAPAVTISPMAKALPQPHAPVKNVTLPTNVSISRTSAVVGRPTIQPAAPTPVAIAAKPVQTQKKVIDVVDLSDDDEAPATPAVQAPQVACTYVNGASPTTIINSGTGPRNQFLVTPVAPMQQSQPQLRNLVPVTSSPVTIQRNQVRQITYMQPQRYTLQRVISTHPAPPPDGHVNGKRPAQPILKISCTGAGIVLSWDVKLNASENAPTKCYQIYAYQESSQAPTTSMWKKVGDVKALPLPMACTLTQFTRGNKYHFTVRAEDTLRKVSLFSDPQSITLS